MRSSNPSKKRELPLLLLKCGGTIALFAWVFSTIGWDNLANEIRFTKPFYIWAAFAVFITSLFLGAAQWHILLKERMVKLPFKQTLTIYMGGMFLNNLPLGMIGGDAYKVAALQRCGYSGSSVFATTFLDRLAGLLIIALFAFGGSTYLLFTNIQKESNLIPAILALLLFTILVFTIFGAILSRRAQRWVYNFLDKNRNFPGKSKALKVLSEVFLNSRSSQEQRLLIKVALLAFVIQTLRISVHILSGCALSLVTAERIPYFFIIVPMIAIFMLIPQFFGMKELAGAALFQMAGFPLEGATIMEFFASIISIIASLAGGVFLLLPSKPKERRQNENSNFMEC